MRCCDEACDEKTEGSPRNLCLDVWISLEKLQNGVRVSQIRTAVIVSMQRTNGSFVRYRESDIEYSFHNWPNRSVLDPILVWLIAKYPEPHLSISYPDLLRI